MLKKLFLSTLLTLTLCLPALAQDEEEWGKPEDLLNKPAPPVELALVDGGKLNLMAHRGKKVVVLDFWATWCPWCVKSTKHFVAAQEKYKDEDVAFYMVAVGQDAKPVQAYLDKNELDVKIALDRERKTADLYWVDYIPHIVVIDKKGKVVKVAVGEDKVGPAIDEALSALLDEEDDDES